MIPGGWVIGDLNHPHVDKVIAYGEPSAVYCKCYVRNVSADFSSGSPLLSLAFGNSEPAFFTATFLDNLLVLG